MIVDMMAAAADVIRMNKQTTLPIMRQLCPSDAADADADAEVIVAPSLAHRVAVICLPPPSDALRLH